MSKLVLICQTLCSLLITICVKISMTVQWNQDSKAVLNVSTETCSTVNQWRLVVTTVILDSIKEITETVPQFVLLMTLSTTVKLILLPEDHKVQMVA